MHELISIVTTLYNYAHYLPDLAKSVLAQTWPCWEWIIVDDCSTDDPQRAMAPVLGGEYFSKVNLIHCRKNRGYSYAKNLGIRESRGNYIIMIDADDMLTPDSLALRYKALAPSDKLWCHGEVQVLNGTRLSDESRQWKRMFRKRLKLEGWDLDKRYHHRLVHAQSVMVRRELHKQLGLYDDTLRFSSDNEMWRRVIRFGHIPVHIEDYVAVYRVHPDRMSRSAFKREHKVGVKKQIIQDVERRYNEGIEARLRYDH